MIGDNICDGDYVICEKRELVNKNDIAVVLINNTEATLKRIHNNHDGTLSLLPSNPSLSPQIVAANSVQVQGIYLGLLRFHH